MLVDLNQLDIRIAPPRPERGRRERFVYRYNQIQKMVDERPFPPVCKKTSGLPPFPEAWGLGSEAFLRPLIALFTSAQGSTRLESVPLLLLIFNRPLPESKDEGSFLP